MNQEESPGKQYPENYPYQEDEIDLIDYLRVLWKWKVFIVLMVILGTGVTLGITMLTHPAKHVTECTISLNFPGIDKHKNPDGELFNKEQVITPAILTKATAFLQKKKKEFAGEGIRGMVDIKGIIPPEIKEKIKAAEKKKESYPFFPNQFSLTITTEQADIFSIKERDQILLSIVDEYRKEFEKTYGEKPLIVIKFPANFLANSDYLDAISTFKVRTNNFIGFLDSKIEEAGFFRSQKTGDSFIDMKNDLELLNNIEISEIEATVKTLKLTKNTENLINVYRHKIRSIDVERKKKENEALVAGKLLKEMKQSGGYEPSKGAFDEKGGTSLVLDTSFIKELVKEDSSALLLKTALQAGIKAKNLQVDKEFLEEEIALLKEEKKGREKNKENTARVETGLKNIESRIIALSKRANELKKEYLEKLINNAVQVTHDPETYKTRDVSMKKIVLLAGVVALFMSVFLAFFIEYIRKHRE
ncbi:hypothetical protein [Desulfobacula sp.]|uniref:hypothetical protein n=1 Tax=Desulfobacula sp. TaxID=2593537 RepID=UPI00261A4751|nr:hypothetical protein [Desulfobacula sp.]